MRILQSIPVRCGLIWVVIVFAASPFRLAAQDDKALQDEFTFIHGLIERGFPDFADKVLSHLEKRHPGEKDRITVARAKILAAQNRVDEAEAMLKNLPAGSPAADSIQLVVANKHYARGDVEKARALYNDFFKRYDKRLPKDPDLLNFYREAAYRYAKMLEAAGDLKGAVNALQKAKAGDAEGQLKRLVQIEQAELLVRLAEKASGNERNKYIEQAHKLTEDVMWGGLDLWFGRAITVQGYLKSLQGDRTGAIKLIKKDYLKDLKAIDKMVVDQGLSRSVSPMAGARFLIGRLYLEEAEKALKAKDRDKAKELYQLALTEYVNVFEKYPESDWGPEAGLKASEIKEAIVSNKLGTVVQDKSKSTASGPSGAVFKAADNLYRQKKYPEAAKEYLRVLNLYPEIEAAGRAVGSLLMCYAHLDDPLYVKTLTDYIGEQFRGNEAAPVGLLRVGKHYVDKNDKAMYFRIYDTYIENFPDHELAPKIIFTLANLAAKNGDKETEARYLNLIAERYPKSIYYVRSVKKSAFDLYLAARFEEALPVLEKYIGVEQAGYDQALGQFFLAEAYRHLNRFDEARKEHEKLISWLARKENNPYRGTLKEKEVLDLLEKSAFFRGLCYAKIKEPADQVAASRDKAIAAYDTFIDTFPKSELVPKALRGKGAVLLELDRTEDAAATFNRIADEFADTEEGKNAFFFMIESLIDIGRDEEARKAFGSMMQNVGSYTPEQFVRIGTLMLDKDFFPEAGQAFAQTVGKTEERALLERALFGLGKSKIRLGQYKEGSEQLNKLMEQYPDSAYFYQAKFLLAEAYRETDQSAEAVEALRDVFKFATDPVLRDQASLSYGKAQQKMGDLKGALGSYSRVGYLSDAGNPKLRPLIEECLLLGIDTAEALENWTEVMDLSDEYLKKFPKSDKISAIRKKKSSAKLKAASSASEGGNTENPTPP